MTEAFWHNLEVKEVEKILQTKIDTGLTKEEVKLRQEKFGLNKLQEEKPLSGARLFLAQFKNPVIYIFLIAGAIALLLQKFTDAAVIFGVVLFNTIFGFVQERGASKTLAALKKVVKHEAEVLREGNFQIVDSTELVPGDIVILNPGDKVPVDGRIVECHDLKINEMALTGEWLPAEKSTTVLPQETSLADRDNMVYMGCLAEDGKGKIIVTATGVNTEIGKIATMVRETKEEKTPYQKRLIHFAKIVGIIVIIICFLIFLLGMLREKEFGEMLITALALTVAAIPGGLPVAMTIILTLGMRRILFRKGLIRKLASTETLGSTSVIATDKTATLTEGKMKADEVIGDEFLVLKAAVLVSEAFIENPDEPKENWILRGRPTDRAFLEAGAKKLGVDCKKRFEKEKIGELPFNPMNKFAAALCGENGQNILYVCGAPEKILEFSKLTPEERADLEKKLEELTQKGLRVVAAAYRKVSEVPPQLTKESIQELCNNLAFTGFITLKDPIRPEVSEAMRVCGQAGMRPIIITGDHRLTGKAVAEELGFKLAEKNILEGKELDKLSEEEFEKILPQVQLYTRAEPRHKMRAVSAWQKRGEVVAMTGDGINDAPALKQSDIGVALGSGTEVAKETSDLILLNDSFSIIVAAVEEGRAILDNIRKVITFLFCISFSEIILISTSILLGWPLPILAAQILWINFVQDGPFSVTLAFEPKEKDLMRRKPAGRAVPLATRQMKALIFIIAMSTSILLVILYALLFNFTDLEIPHIRTIIFAALAMGTFFYLFSCRSLRKNIWQINPFSNRLLILGFIFAVTTLFLAIYLPPLQALLRTVPLRLSDWYIVLGLGLLNLLLIESAKWYFIIRTDQSEK